MERRGSVKRQIDESDPKLGAENKRTGRTFALHSKQEFEGFALTEGVGMTNVEAVSSWTRRNSKFAESRGSKACPLPYPYTRQAKSFRGNSAQIRAIGNYALNRIVPRVINTSADTGGLFKRFAWVHLCRAIAPAPPPCVFQTWPAEEFPANGEITTRMLLGWNLQVEMS